MGYKLKKHSGHLNALRELPHLLNPEVLVGTIFFQNNLQKGKDITEG